MRKGYIPRISNNPLVKSGILTNVAIADVDNFISGLLAKAKTRIGASKGMMDIVSASQVVHVPVVDIVEGILTGKLVKVEIMDPDQKFKGLLVEPAEIRTVISCVKQEGFIWKPDAAELIGLPTEALTKLLKMRDKKGLPFFTEHLVEEDGLLPKQMLNLKEVHAFLRDHISLKEYALKMGVAPRAASNALERAGVEAIAPRKVISRKIYLRADMPA